jgi:hypothetical protein
MKARRKWILLGAIAAAVASDEIPALFEVKAAMQVKEHHLYDVAIQHFVLEACGIKAKPTLMHVNGDYVYDGNQYELEKLF